MVRKLRLEYPGAFHHVTTRGYAKKDLFHDKEDFDRFIDDLNLVYEAYTLPIHAFCLMTNHVHLFTESPEANLQKAMQRLLTRYADYYKRKYRFKNKVFERRYAALLVDSENYAIDLVKYIHLNPVGPIVLKPEHYIYSSYRYFAKDLTAPKFLQKNLVLSRFDKDSEAAKRKLIDFTNSTSSSIWAPENFTLGKSILGSVDFFERVENKIDNKSDPEYKCLVKQKNQYRLDQIFQFIKNIDLDPRSKEDCLIYALKVKTSMANSEIAEKLSFKLNSNSITTKFYRLKQRAIYETGLNQILKAIKGL